MTLIDVPQPTPTITEFANQIRSKISQVVNLADIRLQEIHNLVKEHGRSAIAAELGSDAADMLTVYTKLKEAVEAAKEIEVDDLP